MKSLSKPVWVPKYADWPEFNKLMFGDPDIPMDKRVTLEKFIQMGNRAKHKENAGFNPNVFCKQISDEAFQAHLKSFLDTPIPAEFLTPEREENKKALGATIQALQEGCQKKASKKVLAEGLFRLGKLRDEIHNIPGQKPPEGKEAEKYAPRH